MDKIKISSAFEAAMLLQDFCSHQDDCRTCIYHVSHQANRDDFAYDAEYRNGEGSLCLLNRTYPENWAIGFIKGEREGKNCNNCKHDDTDVCNECRHCIEKWELKEEGKENG